MDTRTRCGMPGTGGQAGEDAKKEEDGKEKKKQKTLQRNTTEENRPRTAAKKIHRLSNRQIQAIFRLPLTALSASFNNSLHWT